MCASDIKCQPLVSAAPPCCCNSGSPRPCRHCSQTHGQWGRQRGLEQTQGRFLSPGFIQARRETGVWALGLPRPRDPLSWGGAARRGCSALRGGCSEMGRKEPQMSLAKPGEAAPRQGQDAPQAPLARSLLSLTFLFQMLKEIRKALSLRWLTPGPSRERTDGGGQAGRAGRRDPRALRSQDPEARGSGRNCKHRALLRSHFWARASAHSSAFARCRLLGGNVPLSGPGSTRHPPSGFLTRWSRPGGARGAAKAELPPRPPSSTAIKRPSPPLITRLARQPAQARA